MSKIFRSKSAAQVIKEYESEPWGKLLLKYGFKPYDTESSAKTIARKAVEDIEFLVNLIYILDCDGFLTTKDLDKLKEFRQFKTV